MNTATTRSNIARPAVVAPSAFYSTGFNNEPTPINIVGGLPDKEKAKIESGDNSAVPKPNDEGNNLPDLYYSTDEEEADFDGTPAASNDLSAGNETAGGVEPMLIGNDEAKELPIGGGKRKKENATSMPNNGGRKKTSKQEGKASNIGGSVGNISSSRAPLMSIEDTGPRCIFCSNYSKLIKNLLKALENMI